MSVFSELFGASFVPVLVQWHGGKVSYWPNDADPEKDPAIELVNVLVSDELRERRRSGDYAVEMVTIRNIQIVTTNTLCEFSGITHPQQNATIGIAKGCEVLKYTVESVIDGDHGMAALSLRRTGRVMIGDKEVIGE